MAWFRISLRVNEKTVTGQMGRARFMILYRRSLTCHLLREQTSLARAMARDAMWCDVRFSNPKHPWLFGIMCAMRLRQTTWSIEEISWSWCVKPADLDLASVRLWPKPFHTFILKGDPSPTVSLSTKMIEITNDFQRKWNYCALELIKKCKSVIVNLGDDILSAYKL